MDDDPEIKKIMQRKLQDMLNQQQQPHSAPSSISSQSQHVSENIVNLTSETFDQFVSLPNLTLVDFWAEWCGPCKAMHPAFEEANLSYPHIAFARVNVDACSDVATRFQIQSIPTFMIFKSGNVIDTVLGAIGLQGIHAMCQKYPA